MKFWFFDGGDVVGPFTPKELMQNKAFSETSLVCPENFSDDGDHWQVAVTFAQFKPFFAKIASEENKDVVTLEQEMNSLLKERSPLLFDETPSDGPGLQIPKKPAKPGPIEDYFNHIKEEDLGDILGIPDPNDDSDMDLAHALEKQLAKTSSTRRREREQQEQEQEVDRQTAQELQKAEQTHHVATATEVFGTQLPAPTQPEKLAHAAEPKPVLSPAHVDETPSMPVVESPNMPTLEPEDPPVQPEQAQDPQTQEQVEELVPQKAQSESQPAAKESNAQLEPETQPEPIQPAPQKSDPKPEPVSETTPADEPQASIIPDPALLRREKVEVNSIRAGLKQTQEMKEFLHETQNKRLKMQADVQRQIIVILLAVVAIIGGLLLMLQFYRPTPAKLMPLPKQEPTRAEQLLEESPTQPTPVVTPAATTQAPATQEQKALRIAQQHRLSDSRGTIAEYLNRIYKTQLSQGYMGTWEAEPLYKNMYIVKYRLTKTRKEPIIYVFRVDVGQGKLTGALNNISLDLVGKL